MSDRRNVVDVDFSSGNPIHHAPDVAAAYSLRRDSVDHSYIDVLSGLLGTPNGPVLDIGAGIGATSHALALDGHEMIAVEPSAAMITQGQVKYPGMNWVQAAGEALPFDDASAGAAVIAYVMHHTDDPVRVLEEAKRVTTGPILVVQPRRDSNRANLFRSYFPTLAPDLPGADDVWWWGCEAGLEAVNCVNTVHWVYPHRILDAAYLELAQCELFAALRGLNPAEFERGIAAMAADLGRPLPPPEVDIVVLQAATLGDLEDPDPEWVEPELQGILPGSLIAF